MMMEDVMAMVYGDVTESHVPGILEELFPIQMKLAMETSQFPFGLYW
jgi:hypothetical protein